jgi:energy-coupling factor transporter transmembrane protein EcfT
VTSRSRASLAAGPLLLGSLVGSLVAARFETALVGIAVATIAAIAAGAPAPRRGGVLMLISGSAIAIVLNGLLVGGAPVLRLTPLPWTITREGLELGALLALRLAGAAVSLHGLRAAWPGEHAADELASRVRWLERLRVPVRAMRAVVGLALRFAPLVRQEAARIVRLQDVRAGGPPEGRREWLARRRAAIVPTIVCGLERAERVALAMEARHYRLRPIVGPPRVWAAELGGVVVAGASLLWRT